jgi:hypothetical protein
MDTGSTAWLSSYFDRSDFNKWYGKRNAANDFRNGINVLLCGQVLNHETYRPKIAVVDQYYRQRFARSAPFGFQFIIDGW